MNWVSLALLAPLLWAISNFVDKYTLGKYTKGIFDFLFFSTITNWVFLIVLLLLHGFPELSSHSWIPIFTGAALLYSYGFYARALGQMDTSSLVVLFKLIPVVTAALAFIFLGQTLAPDQLLGFTVVLAGALVVSFGSVRRKNILGEGAGMTLAAILMFSVLVLFVDYALTKMSFWDFFILDTLGFALAGPALLVVPSMRKQISDGLWGAGVGKYVWFSGSNVLDFFAQMSLKKALAIAPSVGLVTVVAQVQSFYAIVIGLVLTLFFPRIVREDVSFPVVAQKVAGAAVMFFGIYLLVR